MRRDVTARSALFLGMTFAVPMSMYMVYHCLAAHGVMQNYKASSGAYMYWPQNFMYRPKWMQEVYRPEFFHKEMASSLHMYTKRIEKKRSAGELSQEGVHHPTSLPGLLSPPGLRPGPNRGGRSWPKKFPRCGHM